MRKNIIRKILILTLVLAFASIFIALKWIPPFQDKQLKKKGTFEYDTWIDINELNVSFCNEGTMMQDLIRATGGGTSGAEFPKGSGRQLGCGAGIVFTGIPEGGTVEDDLRLTFGLWWNQYYPGPMVNETWVEDNPDFQMYKLTKGVSGPGDPDWDHWKSIGSNYSKFGATGEYAPLIKDPNDPLVTKYGYQVGDPKIYGDQTIWAVFNDANPDMHKGHWVLAGTPPLGIEVKETVFGYDKSGPLGKVIFMKFEIRNAGKINLRDMYFSYWVDPDQGEYSNDMAGCDVDKSLAYIYDGSLDAVYYDYGVCQGFDYMQGPVGRDGEIMPMTSFAQYIYGTDPRNNLELYYYQKGLMPDGSPRINPVTGMETKHMLTGDPVSGTGWLDLTPMDKRIMCSSGPFDMDPGDTNEMVVAFLAGTGKDRISAISGIRYNDIYAQGAFDANFEIPPDPPVPELTIVTTGKEVFISWGDEAESFDFSGYEFEGYNIYMTDNLTPTTEEEWKRIRTYDLVNGVMTITGITLDLETGLLLEAPVQYGTDSGIRRWVKFSTDEFSGGATPWIAEKDYYLAVTSYAYNPIGAPRSLESVKNMITIVPTSGNPGTDYTKVESGTAIEITHVAGVGKADISVSVVDPSVVTGETYKVTFSDMGDGTVSWNLLRGTTPVIQNNTNYTGDWDYPIVEGLIVQVTGANAAPSGWAKASHVEGTVGTTFDTCFSVSFRGKVHSNWASDISDPSPGIMGHDIEIRVKGKGQGQFATAIFGKSSSWTIGGLYQTSLEVWDIEAPGGEEQINFCWWDRDENGVINVPPYERMMLVHSPYDPNTTHAPDDPMATWYFSVYDDLTTAGQIFQINIDNTLVAGVDEFQFTTTAPKINDTELAKNKFQTDIRVVPNPYYGFSYYERNPLMRIIKFINIPQKCTVRIFDLRGVLVRTMHKDDPSSVLVWNGKSDNAIFLSSGVYIYHIESPGLGEVLGKLAIFAEKETVQRF